MDTVRALSVDIPRAERTMRRFDSRLRRAALECGAISSLLYVATDVVGGLRYPGYSFTAQTISELAAFGAPSKWLVDPLLIVYDVLALAFAAAALRTAFGSRAIRVAAWLLVGRGVVGLIADLSPFAGFSFAMHPRGTVDAAGDARHLVLMSIVVLLLLSAIAIGAFAYGKRFRTYSFATLAVVIGASALTVPFAARLAAGQGTPGFGILERVEVYAIMLWLAAFAVALLRRSSDHARDELAAAVRIGGTVAPGFEGVRHAFEQNFIVRGEIGAAFAVYWHGEKVVDLWGGRRRPDTDDPWNDDTMVVVMSATKGLAAMTLAVANARGLLDYDTPIAHYWPEFAQNGKDVITVRQLLAHEAGLVLLDEPLTVDAMRDLDHVASILARQKPAWPPGTRHGYHAMTIGLYAQELIRRVDPKHRTLGQFFREEIAVPLGLDFYIGLPSTIADARLARVKTLSRRRALAALRSAPRTLIEKVLQPGSLLRKSLAIPADVDFNDRRTLAIELPAGNGVGTARSIARAYSAFAEGGAELGISEETMHRIIEVPLVVRPIDEVLGVPTYFSLGFIRPGPDVAFGSSQHAFGFPGAGGSFGFADPDEHLGYAYVMNKLDFWLIDDPRELALRDAVYRAVRLAEVTNNEFPERARTEEAGIGEELASVTSGLES